MEPCIFLLFLSIIEVSFAGHKNRKLLEKGFIIKSLNFDLVAVLEKLLEMLWCGQSGGSSRVMLMHATSQHIVQTRLVADEDQNTSISW
jgi:hypothetical protein